MRVPGLDPGINPRICRWREMAGSSPALTSSVKVKLASGFRRNDEVKAAHLQISKVNCA